jgi:hypothetical protein
MMAGDGYALFVMLRIFSSCHNYLACVDYYWQCHWFYELRFLYNTDWGSRNTGQISQPDSHEWADPERWQLHDLRWEVA